MHDKGSRPKFETRHTWARGPKMKIDKVARTKLGVYNDIIETKFHHLLKIKIHLLNCIML